MIVYTKIRIGHIFGKIFKTDRGTFLCVKSKAQFQVRKLGS